MSNNKENQPRPNKLIHGGRAALATLVLAGGLGVACNNDKDIPPTPTPASRTFTLNIDKAVLNIGELATATSRPTETPKVPEISVQTPNFGIRFDPTRKTYQLIDRKTGNDVSTHPYPYPRLGYQETGVGSTKDITTTLQPGQTAIIQGWKVGGQGNGVFQAVIAKDTVITFTRRLSDGAVAVVKSADGPSEFFTALQTAILNGWAHDNVAIPDAWRVK